MTQPNINNYCHLWRLIMKKIFALFVIFVLTTTSLLAQDLFGPLSGRLEAGTYNVIGNISVEIGDSLTIDPGVTLQFYSAMSFNIYGYLYSVGTASDSIKYIKFPGGFEWSGMQIYDSASDQCAFGYCLMSDASLGAVQINGCTVTFNHCLITNNQGGMGPGIKCQFGGLNLTDCVITQNTASYAGGGIYGVGQSGYDIDINVVNCLIKDNYSNDIGGGICLDRFVNLNIAYSVISDNQAVGNGGAIYAEDALVNMDRCTLYGNTAGGIAGGIYCENENCNNMISNSIFSENDDVAIHFGPLGSDQMVWYTDFYTNGGGVFSGGVPEGLGEVYTVNANGDSCDALFNIFMDPLFAAVTGASAFQLSENSPCIDAGNPNDPHDPDNTVTDMGAYFYDQTPKIVDVIIRKEGGDIVLDWSDAPGALRYFIYRSEEPYFSVAGMTPIAQTGVSEYTDTGAAGEGKYYYRVTFEY